MGIEKRNYFFTSRHIVSFFDNIKLVSRWIFMLLKYDYVHALDF